MVVRVTSTPVGARGNGSIDVTDKMSDGERPQKVEEIHARLWLRTMFPC